MADQAPAGLPETKVITLRKPVSWEGKDIAALSLREPVGAECADIYDHSGWDQTLYAVQRICGVPARAVEMIAARELTEADLYLRQFLYPALEPEAGDVDDSLSFDFLKPVHFDDKVIDKITLREPTGGQVKEMFRRVGFRSTLFGVSTCALLGEAVVDRMGVRDLKRCERWLLRFLA